MMTELDQQEVIAAFADGEPVDPKELTEALSYPAGREHLIDLLVLRGLVGGQSITRPVPIPARRSASHIRRLAVAASLAAISVLGGYVLGHRTTDLSRPPNAVTGAAPDVVPVSAPAPTRIIRLENGVDWNERTGGG